jgi:hypothetical protein
MYFHKKPAIKDEDNTPPPTGIARNPVMVTLRWRYSEQAQNQQPAPNMSIIL